MRRRVAMLLAGSLAGLLVLSGCSDLRAQLSGEQSSEPAGDRAAGPPPALVTESWGVVDGLVSVVVRNPTGRTLRYASATMTARDERGVTVGSSATQSAAERRGCCTVADLPPGATYGLYFDLGSGTETVGEVEISYSDVAWRAPSDAPAPAMKAAGIRLAAGSEGALVVAEIATPGEAVTQAVAQAMLVGPDGELVAVVSGRWNCFAAGGSRRIEMQLFHPVPAGTEVEAVLAYPVLSPVQPAPACAA